MSSLQRKQFGGLAGGSVDMNFPHLQFGGPNAQASILGDANSKFKYNLTLQNTAASGTAVGRLFAPDHSSTGRIVNGAFNDTGSNAGLVGSGSPQSPNVLNEFVRFNPCFVNKIYVRSTSTTNFNYDWNVYYWSPFTGQLESEPILVAGETNEFRNQSGEVTMKRPLFLGIQTYIDIEVYFGTTLNLSMHFSAIQNQQLLFNRTIDAIAQQAMRAQG